MLYGKERLNFFSPSELLDPNVNDSLRLIRARPIFTRLDTNQTLVLQLLFVHFTLVVLLSMMIIT